MPVIQVGPLWGGQPQEPAETRLGPLVYGDTLTGVDGGIWTAVNGPPMVVGAAGRALQYTAASTQYVRRPISGISSIQQTLWAVARIRNWTPASSLVSCGASGTSDYTLLYCANGAISMASVNGATVGQAQTAALTYSDTANYHVFVGRVSGSSYRDLILDGLLIATDTTAVTPATPQMATVGTAWVSGAGASYATADIAAAGVLPFFMQSVDVGRLSAHLSAWADTLLEPRRVFVPFGYSADPSTFQAAWARNANTVIQRAL